MSTKTIAVDTRVYERLAAAKSRGESFSKAIDRLLTQVERASTGGDVLRGLGALLPLSDADSQVFLKIVAENRASEDWEESDLR